MSGLKRAPNFNSKEELILISLVKKYKTVLESKRTDNNYNKQKLECWKKLEKEFNNKSGAVYRNRDILKNKYENIKKRTKKKLADEKVYVLGTGGGPPKKPSGITDIEIEIKEILGERITGLSSEFGGDAEVTTFVNNETDIPLNIEATNVYDDFYENENNGLNNMLSEENETFQLSSVEETTTQPEENKNSKFNSKNGDNITHKLDWSKNTVQNLRTPISKGLCVGEATPGSKRKRNEYDSLCNKVSHWAASKASLESEKIRFAEERHRHEIILMQQKFEKEVELLKKESDARIKKLEEEMEISIKGLTEKDNLKKDILIIEKHIALQKLKNLKECNN